MDITLITTGVNCSPAALGGVAEATAVEVTSGGEVVPAVQPVSIVASVIAAHHRPRLTPTPPARCPALITTPSHGQTTPDHRSRREPGLLVQTLSVTEPTVRRAHQDLPYPRRRARTYTNSTTG